MAQSPPCLTLWIVPSGNEAYKNLWSKKIRLGSLALLLACVWWPAPSAAQSTAETDKVADAMVRLCLGGGRTQATSSTATGGADLSLRSLDVKGNVKGEYKINKSSAEGLINGIDNALSQVAADQADKVRACLQPARDRLLDAMLPSKTESVPSRGVTAPGGVAVGRDLKGSSITIDNSTQQPSR